MSHHFFRKVIAQFHKRGEVITKQPEAIEQSKAREQRTGHGDRHVSCHAIDRRGCRGRLEDANVLLLHRSVDIHRLDQSEHLVVCGLDALEVLANPFVIGQLAARLNGLGVPFLRSSFEILDFQLDGLPPMIHLVHSFFPGNLRELFLGLNVLVQLEDFGMQRAQEPGKLLALGLEQLHLLVRFEQFLLRSRQARQHFFGSAFVRQRFTRSHGFAAGFRLDPLLGQHLAEQVHLGLQVGEPSVQRGEITPGAVALLLQEHDVVRGLKSVQFFLLRLQFSRQLCHLRGHGRRHALRSLQARFPFEAQILLHQVVEKGLGGSRFSANGPQHKRAALAGFFNFHLEGNHRLRSAAGFERGGAGGGRLAQPGQRASLNFRAAQQFRLRSQIINQFLRVEPALANIEFAGQPHAGLGLIGRRSIEGQPPDQHRHRKHQGRHPPMFAQEQPPAVQLAIKL